MNLKMLQFSQLHSLLPPNARVLAAVSGGADSLSLLVALCERRCEPGLSFVACAHLNHGLRGAESDADEIFVRDFCAARGIPFVSERADVAGLAKARGRGLEEAARVARYEFLERAAAALSCDVIATGHTADDNMETVLLNLVRGTGLRGLAGIPPRRGHIVRPLLAVSRAETEAFLTQRGIAWRTDASNADMAYARNRLRRDVLPALKALNPAALRTVGRLTAQARRDADFLDELAQALLAQSLTAENTLPASAVLTAPPALRGRMLRAFCQDAGAGCPEEAHIDGLLALCRTTRKNARLSLPQGFAGILSYGVLSVAPECPPGFVPVSLALPGETVCGGVTLRARYVPAFEAAPLGALCLCAGAIVGGVTARPRTEGDLLRLGTVRKTVKKWMIERKIPRHLRQNLPVLCDEQGILAVCGLGADARVAPVSGEAYWEILG